MQNVHRSSETVELMKRRLTRDVRQTMISVSLLQGSVRVVLSWKHFVLELVVNAIHEAFSPITDQIQPVRTKQGEKSVFFLKKKTFECTFEGIFFVFCFYDLYVWERPACVDALLTVDEIVRTSRQ